MNTLLTSFKRRRKNDRGAASIEYALLASLIAVVIVASVSVFGTRVKALYCLVVTGLGGNCP